MDISMPVMDGYEATKRIRNMENNWPRETRLRSFIFGLTAHSTDHYKNKCFDYGMDDVCKI